jgi:L-ascorbate metabolism protein UlaG (beta-lactamase superfamily)
MKITKFGHCCLLIEENGLRILTDPGTFTQAQDSLKNIDLVLITHEHVDHFHVKSVENIVKNNPRVKIFTNSSVGKFLDEAGIAFEIIEDGENAVVNNILIEGVGSEHAIIYRELSNVMNTGYIINNKLFYPGDAFTIPENSVDILALPVAGPWLKISEAIDYAKAVKPRVCFGVHDGMISKDMRGFSQMMLSRFLKPEDIEYIHISDGDVKEFE